jgi:hypothetical protein
VDAVVWDGKMLWAIQSTKENGIRNDKSTNDIRILHKVTDKKKVCTVYDGAKVKGRTLGQFKDENLLFLRINFSMTAAYYLLYQSEFPVKTPVNFVPKVTVSNNNTSKFCTKNNRSNSCTKSKRSK